MVPLLVYAYCVGVRSSRRIERLCERDVAFRVIAANHVPDDTTIARFRKDYDEALGKLFGQVLALCAEAGLIKVGVVALDGTKMGANASLAANRTAETIEREVRKILEEAERAAAAQQEKIEARQAEEEAAAKKTRGRKPKAPEAVVDEGQLIIAVKVTTDQNDVHRLHPMIEKTREELAAVGVAAEEIRTVLADAGFCSDKTWRRSRSGERNI